MRKRWSVVRLACETELSVAFIEAVEAGQEDIRLDAIEQLGKALGMEVEQFLRPPPRRVRRPK